MADPNIKEVKKEKILPEDIPCPIAELEVKEQLGHLTIQLLQASKTEAHLREVIKNLRKEYAS